MTEQTIVAPTKGTMWTGRVLTGLFLIFMLFDSTMKFMRTPEALKGTADLGWPVSVLTPLGVILLILLALYVIPRTSVLGAIFLTGYLGGAVATHVRIGNPLFSHILFPIYVALIMWVGLALRNPRVRAFLLS